MLVEYETTWSNKPVRQRMWWRIAHVSRNPYRPRWPQEGDRVTSSGSDCWNGDGYSVHFPGNLQAERSEQEDVPPPKVRAGIETRWYQGRWQKCLKSKGWVDA
jgi:hypothetical protein